MAEYEVTGVRWQMGEGLTMEQRTQMAEEFLRTLKVGTPMILAAEPDNPHDNEAIAVYMDYTRCVGYIKHECCAEVKGLLDGDGLILLDGEKRDFKHEDELAGMLYDIELATGVLISPMIMPRKQWESRPFKTPFYINVMNEGIRI